MKTLSTLSLLLFSLVSFAESSEVKCEHLSGTQITKNFIIHYQVKNQNYSDKVQVKLNGNSIGIENNLTGKLVKLTQYEALMPLNQDILIDRAGDYDGLKIDFLFDDHLNQDRYALLRYTSDGPSFAGFYLCAPSSQE